MAKFIPNKAGTSPFDLGIFILNKHAFFRMVLRVFSYFKVLNVNDRRRSFLHCNREPTEQNR